MKTKNYKIYSGFYYYLGDWALLLRFNVESLNKKYVEVEMQIGPFVFSITRISRKYSDKLDKLIEGYKNEKN